MKPELLTVAASAMLAAGCHSAPVAPTVVPPPPVAAVATAVPYTWDSRAELAAWVDNGASRGPATVVGDGTEAVIRVDVNAGDTNLHGPDFDPPLTGVSSARIRYRWLDRAQDDVLFVEVYLRPATYDQSLNIPHLFSLGGGDISKPPENTSGQWVDQVFTAHNMSTPPYTVRFPTISVTGSGTYGPARIHGVVEIDSIALIRQ